MWPVTMTWRRLAVVVVAALCAAGARPPQDTPDLPKLDLTIGPSTRLLEQPSGGPDREVELGKVRSVLRRPRAGRAERRDDNDGQSPPCHRDGPHRSNPNLPWMTNEECLGCRHGVGGNRANCD